MGHLSVNIRPMVLAGRTTSVSLEEAFWVGLKEIATTRNIDVRDLIMEIRGSPRRVTNLSSALRVFVLDYYRSFGTARADDPTGL